MTEVWIWAAGGGLLLMAFFLLRKPLGALWRLAWRSGLGLCALWLLDQAGGLLGIHLGVNLINGLALGVLGVPGAGLLLMLRWVLQGG